DAGLERLALVDVLLVWAVPYAIGLLYADARAGVRVVRRGRVVPVAVLPRPFVLVGVGLAAAALAALLVAVGPYPVSLVGMPGDAMSNLGPPTAPVVLHAVALGAFALAARAGVAWWWGRAGMGGSGCSVSRSAGAGGSSAGSRTRGGRAGPGVSASGPAPSRGAGAASPPAPARGPARAGPWPGRARAAR